MNEQKNVQRFDASLLLALPDVDAETRQWWIDNPQDLQAFLAGLAQRPQPKLDVFKTIKLGTGIKDADGFRKAIVQAHMRIGGWGDDILGKPQLTVSRVEHDLDLVVVSVADLGFRKATRRDKIYERALELGLQLCPAEVGPQLRLQYADQPMDEWLLIGMEPIRDSDSGLGVFRVGRYSDGLWLNSDYGRPDCMWGPDSRWVFVRPRK